MAYVLIKETDDSFKVIDEYKYYWFRRPDSKTITRLIWAEFSEHLIMVDEKTSRIIYEVDKINGCWVYHPKPDIHTQEAEKYLDKQKMKEALVNRFFNYLKPL